MTSTTAPIFLSPSPSEAEVLLRRVSSWPFVRVDAEGRDAVIYSGIPETCVARLDVETGALTVLVDADVAPPLVEPEPPLRRSRDGVHLDVHDSGSRAAAERLLRWRIDLERFASQLRVASP